MPVIIGNEDTTEDWWAKNEQTYTSYVPRRSVPRMQLINTNWRSSVQVVEEYG